LPLNVVPMAHLVKMVFAAEVLGLMAR